MAVYTRTLALKVLGKKISEIGGLMSLAGSFWLYSVILENYKTMCEQQKLRLSSASTSSAKVKIYGLFVRTVNTD